MVDYNEQYRLELESQEVKSNIRTFKCIFWYMGALLLTCFLTVVGLFHVSKRYMFLATGVAMLLFLDPLVLWLRSDLKRKTIKYALVSRICIITGTIITFMSYHAVLLYVTPLIVAIQYKDKKVLWHAFGWCLAILIVSAYTSFYFGVCDLNMLFDNANSRQWILEYLATHNGVLPLDTVVNYTIATFVIIPRAIILLAITLMLRHSVLSNADDAVRIAELTYRKETDDQTRLSNKNKYDEMVEDYYPKVDKVGIAFFDINNLKSVNDKFGHAAGDALIESFAKILCNEISKKCRIYRVGGDEFVLICENPKAGDVEVIVNRIMLKNDMEREKGRLDASCAVGIAYGQGKFIHDIIAQADKKMYENKEKIKSTMARM